MQALLDSRFHTAGYDQNRQYQGTFPGTSPMNYAKFNAICGSLPATSSVVQWGGAQVWKVGGKVFAIGGWSANTGITFKVSPLDFELLQTEPGLRPAPYLASRGMKWIQHYDKPGLSDTDLEYYLRNSHRIVSQGLSKKKQKELGLRSEEHTSELQ